MPYKANEPRRHKIPRARYKIANWPEYDRALQQRGSLTVWVTPEALAAWHPPKTGRRGRSREYSDLAIETGHLLRLAFGRPWRQTEGLLRSLATLLGLSIGIPDHTTFSRRSPGLSLASALAEAQRSGPVHVVIDSTGLKVYGAGEWLAETHGDRGQRTWRKLHLAVDPETGEILASELTVTEAGDASLVGPLLDQVTRPIASVTADGAYDGEPVYRAVAARQPDPPATVIIPPRATAVPSPTTDTEPTQRDRHLRMIQDKGRMGWQKAVGYGRRSLGETAMFRYKAIIGRGLRARTLPAQKTEARAACSVLNRMTRLGMPVSQRIV
jgi:Transposase DDE domain